MTLLLMPADFVYLRSMYPRFSDDDIQQRFKNAAAEIERVIDPAYLQPGNMPATLYAAALLKVHHSLEKNRWRRADSLGGYFRLLDQYEAR